MVIYHEQAERVSVCVTVPAQDLKERHGYILYADAPARYRSGLVYDLALPKHKSLPGNRWLW